MSSPLGTVPPCRKMCISEECGCGVDSQYFWSLNGGSGILNVSIVKNVGWTLSDGKRRFQAEE